MEKSKRVKSKEDFQKVISSNLKINSNSYVIYYKDNTYDYCRFGISASKKLGGAVTRVKIRRQVRAMVDQITKEMNLVKSDYVIIVRKGYLENDFLKNYKNLSKLFSKIGGIK